MKEVPVAARESFIADEKKQEELGITRRELEILERIAQGMSNREIAEKLYVREHGQNPLPVEFINRYHSNDSAP